MQAALKELQLEHSWPPRGPDGKPQRSLSDLAADDRARVREQLERALEARRSESGIQLERYLVLVPGANAHLKVAPPEL